MPNTANASAADFYGALKARYAGKSDATPSRGFGSKALKVNGKIFASLTKNRLLLKLPEARVDALVKSKKGQRFSTGVGRVKNGLPSRRAPRRNGWGSPMKRAPL